MKNDVIAFSLANGETKTLNIPRDSVISVSENEVAHTDHRLSVAASGLDFHNTMRPFLTVCLSGSAQAIFAGWNRRRRREDGYDDKDTGQCLGGKARASPASRCGPPGGLDPPKAVLISGPRARGDETLFSGAPPEILPRRAPVRSLRPQAACRTPAAAGHEAKACVSGMIPARNRMNLLRETILTRARGDPQHIPKRLFGPTRHPAVVWKGG